MPNHAAGIPRASSIPAATAQRCQARRGRHIDHHPAPQRRRTHQGQPRDAWQNWEADLARGLLDDLSAHQLRPLRADQRQRETDLLGRLQALDDKTLEAAGRDQASGVRVHAMRVLAERPQLAGALQKLAQDALKDPDPFVQRCAVPGLQDFTVDRDIADRLLKVMACGVGELLQVGVGAPRPFVDRMRDLNPQQRDRVLQSSRAFQNLAPEQQNRIRQQFNQWDHLNAQQRADLVRGACQPGRGNRRRNFPRRIPHDATLPLRAGIVIGFALIRRSLRRLPVWKSWPNRRHRRAR